MKQNLNTKINNTSNRLNKARYILDKKDKEIGSKIKELFKFPEELTKMNFDQVFLELSKRNIKYEDIIKEIEVYNKSKEREKNLRMASAYANITFLGQTIPIRSGDVPTAQISFGTNQGQPPEITVGHNIIDKGFLNIAGAVIHEVAHYKYTYPILDDFINFANSYKNAKSSIFFGTVWECIKGVVEDIYIEDLDVQNNNNYTIPLWTLNKSEYGFPGELNELQNKTNSEYVLEHMLKIKDDLYESYFSSVKEILQDYYKKILKYNEIQKNNGKSPISKEEIENNFKQTISTLIDNFKKKSEGINKINDFFNYVLYAGKTSTYKGNADIESYKKDFSDLLTKYVELNYSDDFVKRFKKHGGEFIDSCVAYIKLGNYRSGSEAVELIKKMAHSITEIFKDVYEESTNKEEILRQMIEQAKQSYEEIMNDSEKRKQIIENSKKQHNNQQEENNSQGGEGGISITVNTQNLGKQGLKDFKNQEENPSVNININDDTNGKQAYQPDISNPFGLPNPYQAELGDNNLSKNNSRQNKAQQNHSNGGNDLSETQEGTDKNNNGKKEAEQNSKKSKESGNIKGDNINGKTKEKGDDKSNIEDASGKDNVTNNQAEESEEKNKVDNKDGEIDENGISENGDDTDELESKITNLEGEQLDNEGKNAFDKELHGKQNDAKITDDDYNNILERMGVDKKEMQDYISNFKLFNEHKTKIGSMIKELVNIIKITRTKKELSRVKTGLLSGKSISTRNLYKITTDYKIFESKLNQGNQPIHYISMSYDISGSVVEWLDELHKSHVLFSEAMRQLKINTGFTIFEEQEMGEVVKSVGEKSNMKKDLETLGKLQPGGGTRIMGGIKASLIDMIQNKPKQEKGVIFVVTDGADNSSTDQEIKNVFEQAKLNNITIVGINVDVGGYSDLDGFARIFKNDYIVTSNENFGKDLRNKLIKILK